LPKPSSRLDLLVVPADPDHVAPVDVVRDLGRARGWWDDDGAPGPAADALVAGGFRAARLEVLDRARLFANQQGGFAVACPACGAPVVRAFEAAVRGWRDATGPRALACPACGAVTALEALAFRPDAAFARTVLHLADVGAAEVRPDAREAIAAAWGAIRVVGRRTW
jgi:hypothetical protein